MMYTSRAMRVARMHSCRIVSTSAVELCKEPNADPAGVCTGGCSLPGSSESFQDEAHVGYEAVPLLFFSSLSGSHPNRPVR